MAVLNKFIVYIALCLVVLSCKQTIIIDVDDHEAELVVSGQLVADSNLRLSLGATQNITDQTGPHWVNNGFIEVYNKDTQLLDVLSNGVNGIYQSIAFKPKPNTNYLFKFYGLGKTAWVNEVMPDTFALKFIDSSRVVFKGEPNRFQITFQVDQTRQNKPAYYGIKVKRHYFKVMGTDTQYFEDYASIASNDLILNEDSRSAYSTQHLLFSNRIVLANSQTYRINLVVDSAQQKTTALDLQFSSMSQSGFNYFSSLYEHVFYQNNPFVQPNALVGNVLGAYGALTGKIEKQIRVRF